MFEIVALATLDVVSAAGKFAFLMACAEVNLGYPGFGYDTNTLEDNNDELAAAFTVLYGTHFKPKVGELVGTMFPKLKPFIVSVEVSLLSSYTDHVLIESRQVTKGHT